MIWFWVIIAITLIAVLFVGINLGKIHCINRLYDDNFDEEKYRKNAVDAVSWLGALGVWFIIFALPMNVFQGLRDYYIDAYRSHKIIRNVEYKYKVIDGVQVFDDSTSTYVFNR